MSDHEIDVENVAGEVLTGQCTLVAALVIALHENGVLPQDIYSDVLQRLWSNMPEEEAIGEAGAVIEQVLDLLAARAAPPFPINGAGSRPHTLAPSRTALSCAILRQGDIPAAANSQA